MNYKNIIKVLILAISVSLLFSCRSTKPVLVKKLDNAPKREFRGVWVQTVGQSRYREMNSAQIKQYLAKMVRQFDAAGINAVIFQVRPEADAFYKSNLEPWSKHLTGIQGQAPDDPTFDPLAFMIEQCHKKGIELHAWLNPYRASTQTGSGLAPQHIYWKHPERFLEYGNQLFFDPGIPENRAYICDVVRDIVKRYDIDAIHMDDYFYPYPIPGTAFPDNESFSRYAPAQGFSSYQRADWRRNNVNQLIRELKNTILGTKPWVQFGISPFGIYRNKKSTVDGSGSETNGLQNYDDLYADILLWAKKGWIDYNIPQLYWQIGHHSADYTTLLKWWNENAQGCPLYIGQDIKRSMDSDDWQEKNQLMRQMNYVNGNCYWYGYLIQDNYKNIANILESTTHKYKALTPAFGVKNKNRIKVGRIDEVFTKDMHLLTWPKASKLPYSRNFVKNFVIYRFRQGEKIDITNARNIVDVTPDNFYILPYEGGHRKYTYVITTLDINRNESKGKKFKVKL